MRLRARMRLPRLSISLALFGPLRQLARSWPRCLRETAGRQVAGRVWLGWRCQRTFPLGAKCKKWAGNLPK